MLFKCFRCAKNKIQKFGGNAGFTRMLACDFLITANAVNDLALCVTSNICINTHTKRAIAAQMPEVVDSLVSNQMSSVAFVECYRKRQVIKTVFFYRNKLHLFYSSFYSRI